MQEEIKPISKEYSTLLQQRIDHIKNNPESHKHNYNDLVNCCMINGVVVADLFTIHSNFVPIGINGSVKCDVTSGPCNCGAWH